MKKRVTVLLAGALLCFTGVELGVQSAQAEIAGMSEGAAARVARKANRKTNKKKLSNVCKSTTPLKKALLKNAYPGHINLSDPRAPGFAFVCGPDCPKKFPVSAYYSDGTLAFKLGYYGTWEGNGRPRAYCGAGGVAKCSASGVTKAARTKGRDGKVYLDFGNKSCRSATPGARNGSPF